MLLEGHVGARDLDLTESSVRRWVEQAEARFAALAPAHPQLASDQVQVGYIECDRFGPAQATAICQGNESGVAPAPGGRVLAVALAGRPGAGLEETAQRRTRWS
jgi:hypothetical protein